MVYFLGRDVNVAISTESTTAADDISVAALKCVSGSASGIIFAADMSTALFAQFTSGNGLVDDCIGVDVSVGAMDEDTAFVGQKQGSKVEIKKEITVSLTRKKANDVWDTIYNGVSQAASLENFTTDQVWGARWGLDLTTATTTPYLGVGLSNPKDVILKSSSPVTISYGYRIHVQLKQGAGAANVSETLSIPNCVITSYTIGLNADGVTEETLEFSTQQSMLHSTGLAVSNALTAQGGF